MKKAPRSIDSAASLLKETEAYVDAKLEYGRLKLIEKAADVSGELFIVVILGLISVGILLALSFALAYVISLKTGSEAEGFFAVGGLYLMGLIIVYLLRAKLIQVSVVNALIHKLNQ